MKRSFVGKVFQGILCCLALSLPVNFACASDADVVGVVDSYLARVEQSTNIEEAKKKEIVDAVKELRDDELNRFAAITEGLAIAYPEFADALEMLGGDDTTKATEKLKSLTTSDDPFLANEAKFFLARTLMMDQAHEDAIPLLEEVLGDRQHFAQSGTATYFEGVAQASLLRNQEALKALKSFVDEYPNAPERMRIAAIRQIQLLSAIEEGSLLDVFQRMDFSRRRLELAKTGADTQAQQDKVVDMLNVMIKQAEDQECKSCSSCKNGDCDKEGEAQGSKPKEGKGNGKSQSGGGSNQPDGVVKKVFDNGPASAWSQLRDRDRDAALSSIKEKFPARYQKLVEQYFKSFQETGSE
jgi:tetratricopeptide (TPR) repeat protein